MSDEQPNYEQEITEFLPKTVEELYQIMEKTGLLEKTAKGKYGDEDIVVWTQRKIEKLYAEVQTGERSLKIVKDETSINKEQLVSEVPIVISNIKIVHEGKSLRLKQGRQHFIEENGVVTEGEIEWLEDESLFGALGGKVKPNEQREKAMAREVQEELGDTEKIVIKIKSMQKVIDEKQQKTSAGYPGLVTEYVITGYEVELEDESYRDMYRELKYIENKDGKIESVYNVFGWEEI